MSKDELVNLAFSLLHMLPGWQYDLFIDELLDDGEDNIDDGEYEYLEDDDYE